MVSQLRGPDGWSCRAVSTVRRVYWQKLVFCFALNLVLLACTSLGDLNTESPTTPTVPSSPPSIGAVRFSPTGVGLAGATQFTFLAENVRDSSQRPLTYSWNFGDGEVLAGASPVHVYRSGGTFRVTVTVSNGQASSNAGTDITVRDLSEIWQGTYGPDQRLFRFSLIQSADRVSGGFVSNGELRSASITESTLKGPREVELVIRGSVGPTATTDLRFSGVLDPALDVISGQVLFGRGVFTMKRFSKLTPCEQNCCQGGCFCPYDVPWGCSGGCY
jgi:hypothetical protein